MVRVWYIMSCLYLSVGGVVNGRWLVSGERIYHFIAKEQKQSLHMPSDNILHLYFSPLA